MAVALAGAPGTVELCPRRATTTRAGNLAAQLAWQASGLRHAARQESVALVHAPAYPPPPLPVPVVWSVFDDIILGGHREWARKATPLWSRLAHRAVPRVARIVTYTNSVAAELIAAGVDPSRLVVTRPYAPPLCTPTGPPSVHTVDGRPAVLPDEFLLVVGTLEARKRPSVAAVIAATAGLPVVFAGGAAQDPVSLGLEGPGVLLAGRVADGELAWCYQHALALLACSAYEGVDLPVLEACRYHLPVLASDIPVHQELLDLVEGVTLFDDDQSTWPSLVDTALSGPVPSGSLLADQDEFIQAHRAVWDDVLLGETR
jgi:glycosyltransferase involved in cell wall biosynthesis